MQLHWSRDEDNAAQQLHKVALVGIVDCDVVIMVIVSILFLHLCCLTGGSVKAVEGLLATSQ